MRLNPFFPEGTNYASETVKTLTTQRLTKYGYAVSEVPGNTYRDSLVRFQKANLLPDGSKLDVDGGMGQQTDTALFTEYRPVGADLLSRVLAVAQAMIGVEEYPRNSNKGPQIKQILSVCGLPEGYAWCAAYLAWVFREAGRQMQLESPYPNDAGVLNQWDLAGYRESSLVRIPAEQAKKNFRLVKPGMAGLLRISENSRAGHIFLVLEVNYATGKLVTVEGNTNQELSREGVGVFKLTRRTIYSANVGFIDYLADRR